jgi:glycosyltransferase involved in cell wall biosynthesis
MLGSSRHGLHVVVLGVDLDPARRAPAELVSAWPDFGHFEAAATKTGQFRVTVVQASWRDEEREVEGICCHFVREPEPTLRLPWGRAIRRLPRRLLARVKELGPDIVHFSGLGFSREVWALRASLPMVPIVAQAHSSSMPNGFRRQYFRWGAEPLDAAMFFALAQGEGFKRNGLLPKRLPLFEVIEGSTLFTPGDQVEARAEVRLSGAPCLFWLGNLNWNKDPLMVLDATSKATQALPGLRLYMCFQNATLLDRVRERVASDPALRERVVLIGALPHRAIETHLRAADFLIQGSHREGSGYGVIEALACGTTPLVTDIPSFRRITGQGKYGALVPVGDSEALAREIIAFDRRDRGALRQGARKHFERELSFDAAGRQLRETYLQVMELR